MIALHVQSETVTQTAYRCSSGAVFDDQAAAYRHAAAWLIVTRDVRLRRRVWIGPPLLVARLARWLRWHDRAATRRS